MKIGRVLFCNDRILIFAAKFKTMEKSDCLYTSYLNILKEELVPAMGCTEPICLAYAAAKARKVLGTMPKRVVIVASGNIIKNVKSVIVPNTGGLKGLKASVAAGIVAGNPDNVLEVIADVKPEQKQEIARFLETTLITVEPLDCVARLDITVRLYDGDHSSSVRIAGHHTNVVSIEKDGKSLFECECSDTNANMTDRECLKMEKIYDFATTADLADLRPVIERQITCNKAIAIEGLKSKWGANIGSTLLRFNNDVRRLPVLAYAEEFGIDEERTIRAVTLSNLIAIHQKTGIGRLSAYCGAVRAGCAAGCGIAYLMGEGLDIIAHTLENALGMAAGIVCDGAKPSCA